MRSFCSFLTKFVIPSRVRTWSKERLYSPIPGLPSSSFFASLAWSSSKVSSVFPSVAVAGKGAIWIGRSGASKISWNAWDTSIAKLPVGSNAPRSMFMPIWTSAIIWLIICSISCSVSARSNSICFLLTLSATIDSKFSSKYSWVASWRARDSSLVRGLLMKSIRRMIAPETADQKVFSPPGSVYLASARALCLPNSAWKRESVTAYATNS